MHIIQGALMAATHSRAGRVPGPTARGTTPSVSGGSVSAPLWKTPEETQKRLSVSKQGGKQETAAARLPGRGDDGRRR